MRNKWCVKIEGYLIFGSIVGYDQLAMFARNGFRSGILYLTDEVLSCAALLNLSDYHNKRRM